MLHSFLNLVEILLTRFEKVIIRARQLLASSTCADELPLPASVCSWYLQAAAILTAAQ